MALDPKDYGYYRSDGIQNSGTALRRDGNAYIYNSAGQIYPRQITQTDVSIVDITDNITYQCMTVRSGYNGNGKKSSWRTDVAYQGYYSGPEGNPKQSCGHFFSSVGKPSIGENVSDFHVKYVKIILDRRKSGYYNNTIDGQMRMSNLINCYKDGNTANPFRSARYSDVDPELLKKYVYKFRWLPTGQPTTLESSDPNSDLCKFINNFLHEDKAKTLCIWNGEEGVRPYSANYGSCSTNGFAISIKIDRTIQM